MWFLATWSLFLIYYLLLVTSAQDPDTWDSLKHLKGLKEGIFLTAEQCDQSLYHYYML